MDGRGRSRRDFRERAFLPSFLPSIPLSPSLFLDPNDSPVPIMLVDVDGGGDGIETKPITSLDGRSRRRRRRLCFVIYPRGWNGGGQRSGLGCVNSPIGFRDSVAESCRGREAVDKSLLGRPVALLRSHAATKAVHTCS